MAIQYTAIDISTSRQDITFDERDVDLIESFKVNSLFNPIKHFIEAHYYIDNTLFFSDRDYKNFRIQFDSESAGREGTSRITLDPITDVKTLEFTIPETTVEYNYYNNLYSNSTLKNPNFFIDEISEDRLEVKLKSQKIDSDTLRSITAILKSNIETTSPFNDFILLFENNIKELGINVDIIESNNASVIVRLYKPLRDEIQVKDQLQVVEQVSDTSIFTVEVRIQEEKPIANRLAEPNFNIEVSEESNNITGYLNTDTLLSLDSSYNQDRLELISNSEIQSITLNIDYRDFKNFINYSSAVERLENFKYKVELIQGYETSLQVLNNDSTSALSRKRFQTLIEGIVRNFDQYEKHLYFENTEYAWPKEGVVKPYVLKQADSIEVQQWFENILDQARIYDQSNINTLINTIPGYLREDSRNEPYLVFVNMIGHHFDNLWIYTKAITSKYDADNRIDKGISKDLVEEVLKNFGVKLYTDSSTAQDLYRYFTDGGYDQGQEIINNYITNPLEKISGKNYTKELYKRIYHNLPLLLKTKGTSRSIKVLINCFGVPVDRLPIKQYGGVKRDQLPYFGQERPIINLPDKVKTGIQQEIQGNTLSYYAGIRGDGEEYTNDLHKIEVGYSPTDDINNYIITNIEPLFNIDNHLGDPTGKGYKELERKSKELLKDLKRFDLKDYIRLIKFFDNKLFKMIKDYTPARAVVDTGVIIKPHILQRSTYSNLEVSGFEETITGSIDTAFITGSEGKSFGKKTDIIQSTTPGEPPSIEVSDYITSWIESIQTPDGIKNKPIGDVIGRTDGETPRYTGEFSGSVITATTGELNEANVFKKPSYTLITYGLRPVTEIIQECECGTTIGVLTLAPSNIETGSMTFNGNVEKVGFNCELTIRGFVYSSTVSDDTLQLGVAGTETISGNFISTGSYQLQISTLTPGTTYYVRAFVASAILAEIVCYGQVIETATLPLTQCEPFGITVELQ